MTTTVAGKAQGPAIEILNAISANGGPDFRFVYTPWRRALDNVQANPANAILPITRTPSREHAYRWLAKLFESRTIIVTASRPAPSSIEEAQALRVGIVAGGAMDQEDTLAKLGFTKVEKVHSDSLNALKLHQGHLDAWVVDDSRAKAAYRAAGFDPAELKFGVTVGELKGIYLAASPKFPVAQANSIEKAMRKVQHGKKLDEILRRYGGN